MNLKENKPLVVVAVGAMAGLLVAVGILIGMMTSRPSGQARFPLPMIDLAETSLHATASHGTDTFIAATGQIDQYAEGLFLLDALTGDLQCVVMSNRTAKFASFYKTNVLDALGVQGKKPQFLLVTGYVEFRSGGTSRPAHCVAYVVDANTGRYAAYGVPLGGQTKRAVASGQLLLLDVQDARSADINE